MAHNTMLLPKSILIMLIFGIETAAVLDNNVNSKPRELAIKVIDQILAYEQKYPGIFIKWSYGPALIFDAIQRTSSAFGLNYTSTLYSYLDKFTQDPSTYGYKILHDITVPYEKAVGDGIGLFPIAYLNRMLEEFSKHGQMRASDVKIVHTVVSKYLLEYPNHLPDGTFSRHESWDDEPDKNASFIWGDDQYMGLTLLARVARHHNDLYLAKFVGQMAVNYAKYMRDPLDDLYYHGYNNADLRTSCCKWGRANGWGMMSHVEVLEALQHFPELHSTPLFTQMLQVFQRHSLGIARVQSTSDGRWHQVLNETSTFFETSATTMFTSSIIRGILHGWLNTQTFEDVVLNAWKGIQKIIQPDGTVNGICTGTGIQVKLSDYEARSTDYKTSGAGLGSVIHALVDLHWYKMTG